jgi:hypothetical protein
MGRYLADQTDWDDALFNVLDRVFAMSESLVMDPEERTHVIFAQSPEALLASVEVALRRLDELVPPDA